MMEDEKVAASPADAVVASNYYVFLAVILAVLVAFVVLFAIHFTSADDVGLPYLIGDRTVAVFDLWSLQHLGAGVLLGSLVMVFPHVRMQRRAHFALAIMSLAVLWEAAELAMEIGWFGNTVSNWNRGFEHWGNRFIGDVLLVVVGALFAMRYSKSWRFLVVPVGLWLTLNVIAPDSMFIQEWFSGLIS